MYLFWEIVFCLTALGILHTYLFYPALLMIASAGKKPPAPAQPAELPDLTIVCAAYNEQKVIEEKIHSTFRSTYPAGKIKLLIGTDNCSDRTVEIIRRLQDQYKGLVLTEFTTRTGKIGIINALCQQADTSLLVMTDANVFFNPDTLERLVHHFSDEKVGMVCARVVKRAVNRHGVTHTELRYMNLENRLKYAESNLMGLVMGAEGGCYALRRTLFRKIPGHFIADDFFITCLVLRARSKVVFDNEAIVHEDVEADTRGEFRRKARIATGNFQNLFYFRDLFYRFWTATAFAFFSHKALRWFTPFLFLFNMLACVFLRDYGFVFQCILFVQVGLILLPLLNALATTTGIKLKPLAALSHFMLMNAALAVGFFRYLRGVKNSVWEPVKR